MEQQHPEGSTSPSFMIYNITPSCKYSEATPEAFAFCNHPIKLVLFSKQQRRKISNFESFIRKHPTTNLNTKMR